MGTSKLPSIKTEFKPNKDKWVRMLITALILALLVLGGYLCYDKGIKPHIQKIQLMAYNSGQLSVVTSITKTGNIPFLNYNPETNETSVNEISLQELCENER